MKSARCHITPIATAIVRQRYASHDQVSVKLKRRIMSRDIFLSNLAIIVLKDNHIVCILFLAKIQFLIVKGVVILLGNLVNVSQKILYKVSNEFLMITCIEKSCSSELYLIMYQDH